jgi:fructose-bisphosphate aldolase class 1
MLGDNIARILQNGKGILAADDMPGKCMNCLRDAYIAISLYANVVV